MARSRSSSRYPRVFPTTSETPVLELLRVDRHLAAVCEGLRVLKYITPVNAASMRQRYLDGNVPRRGPDFLYRVEDNNGGRFDSLKSRLLSIPIEGEDELSHVYRRKRDEVYDLLTMLQARGTPEFLRRSQLLFGSPTSESLGLIQSWLSLPDDEHAPGGAENGQDLPDSYNAEAARQQLLILAQSRDLPVNVRVRKTLVSNAAAGETSVGLRHDIIFTEPELRRVFVHEIETHILRGINGGRQPFRTLFYHGFPRHGDGAHNYIATEEGLATVAEELSGQLTNWRKRILGARVLAVYLMVAEGLGFNDIFDVLVTRYNLSADDAFTTTMRAFRGGGYTKDYVYWQGYLTVRESWRRALKAARANGHTESAGQGFLEDESAVSMELDHPLLGTANIPAVDDFRLLFLGKVGLDWLPLLKRLYNDGEGVLHPPRVIPTWYEEALARRDTEVRTPNGPVRG